MATHTEQLRTRLIEKRQKLQAELISIDAEIKLLSGKSRRVHKNSLTTKFLEFAESRGGTITQAEILAAFPDRTKNCLNGTLVRMFNAGQIYSVARGVYCLPGKVPQLIIQDDSDQERRAA